MPAQPFVTLSRKYGKQELQSFKGGFGFLPILAYLDNTNEALAGVLRPGNAGANTAAFKKYGAKFLARGGKTEAVDAIGRAGAPADFGDYLKLALKKLTGG